MRAIVNTQSQNASSLIVLTTFNTLWPAEILVARLQAEGIDASIPDRHLINANAFLVGAIGGVRVMVQADELAQAREIVAAVERGEFALTEVDFNGPLDDPVERCPRCGSGRVIQDDTRKRRALVSVFLLGIPLPFSRKDKLCGNCSHRWR